MARARLSGRGLDRRSRRLPVGFNRGLRRGAYPFFQSNANQGCVMKTGPLLAILLLAGACWPLSASAQGVPRGSYLRTCENVYIRGDTLIATCRRADGYA